MLISLRLDSSRPAGAALEHVGVPISIVSRWAGHYDPAFTQKTHEHASQDDMRRARQDSQDRLESCEKL
jgi:integrase